MGTSFSRATETGICTSCSGRRGDSLSVTDGSSPSVMVVDARRPREGASSDCPQLKGKGLAPELSRDSLWVTRPAWEPSSPDPPCSSQDDLWLSMEDLFAGKGSLLLWCCVCWANRPVSASMMALHPWFHFSVSHAPCVHVETVCGIERQCVAPSHAVQEGE